MVSIIGCSDSVDIIHHDHSDSSNVLNFSVEKIISTDRAYPLYDITFSLPTPGHVRLVLLNSTGYEVKELLNEDLQAGSHFVSWALDNNDGERINNGIYILDIVAGDLTDRKVLIFEDIE